MKKVETLPLAEVQAGMTVHQAIADAGGRVLMPAGAVLTDANLTGLARRDVAEICVEYEVTEDPAVREAYRATLATRLDHLFRQVGSAPEARLIYQAVLAYRMEHRA
jgi:hypothetical protein